MSKISIISSYRLQLPNKMSKQIHVGKSEDDYNYIDLDKADLIAIRDQINEILGEDKPESPWPLPRWRPDEIIGPDSVRNPQGVKITYTNGTGHE